MTSVAKHYEDHLASIYVWMAGGMDHALSLGKWDLADVIGSGGTAVDLGAGFGMHTIPLARAGYKVLALDTSSHLLDELRRHSAGLDVQVEQHDMLHFAGHLSSKADLILCMGDTLPHLQTMDEVNLLLQRIAESLSPTGRFVATFRDYTRLPSGASRFIPVRSDSDRIHTCFLEEESEYVVVYDVIHERVGDDWTMKVSSYKKLRISPQAINDALLELGLKSSLGSGPRGMVRVVADA
ncbi:MAG: class I SAM-dependent methyltransferase [Ectothiorhodospiraceae bacterium]|nr:class I SAM-dependent methyltransferase [Ectothiorhodospiraceae bacterium]MCH8505646.1 class I SAM-dependent methyltransferase [Ectothiorhodospiraceae bacterium]